MKLSTIHDQVEQARAYINALLDTSANPRVAEQVSAALEKINAQLAALAGAALPPEAPPSAETNHECFKDTLLAAVLDQINSVAVIYDQNGVVQLANRYATLLFGFDPTQMEREALLGRLTIRDEQGSPIPPAMMPASRASRGETIENVRMEITNPQGRVFHVVASAAQVGDGSHPGGVVSIWNDYTEHKNAEIALGNAHTEAINERNRLQAVMEALPTGLAIYDQEGGITQSNHGYEEIWGGPRPPAYSVKDYDKYKAWWVENGKPVQAEEWASYQAARFGKTVINQFIEIQRFDGRSGYVLNSGAPVYDAQGNITGSAVAIRDITNWVIAERALKLSEERFRVALASLPMTVFTLDEEFRYTWVHNPQFGFTVEQMLGKRDEEIFVANAALLPDEKKAVIETGQSIQREVNAIINDDWKTLLVSLEPLRDTSQRITGIIGAALDMTERRRIEGEHQEAVLQMELQRLLLEHREKERQEIAREIHDGPIQSIVAEMYRLHASKDDLDNSQARAVLENVASGLRAAVQELREVVNELRPPVLTKYGLARAIQIHSEDFRAKNQGVRLELDLVEDANLLPEDTCLALYRIYQESLNNVLRHSEASEVLVRYYPVKNTMVLEIKDNGRGFTPPTNWVSLTRGNHFGLAGMRERAEAIGARFTISSTPGQGAQISVRMPLK